jgi:hypothetical protein
MMVQVTSPQGYAEKHEPWNPKGYAKEMRRERAADRKKPEEKPEEKAKDETGSGQSSEVGEAPPEQVPESPPEVTGGKGAALRQVEEKLDEIPQTSKDEAMLKDRLDNMTYDEARLRQARILQQMQAQLKEWQGAKYASVDDILPGGVKAPPQHIVDALVQRVENVAAYKFIYPKKCVPKVEDVRKAAALDLDIAVAAG